MKEEKPWNKPMKKFSPFKRAFVCPFRGHEWSFVAIYQTTPPIGCQLCQRCGCLGDNIKPTAEQLKDCWGINFKV